MQSQALPMVSLRTAQGCQQHTRLQRRLGAHCKLTVPKLTEFSSKAHNADQCSQSQVLNSAEAHNAEPAHASTEQKALLSKMKGTWQ